MASTGKLDLVRSLGADHVLDYTHDDFADGSRRYDLVLDIAGNPHPVPAPPSTHPNRDRWSSSAARRAARSPAA